MEKNYAIRASYTTVRDLINMLQDLPNDAIVTCCGVEEFYINVFSVNDVVTIDTDNLMGEE